MSFPGASSSSPSLSSSTSVSSSTSRWAYDVFLSFRGEDTRHNFTSHLYYALREKGINTFVDNDLRSGEEISPALLKAIEESSVSVIIFSKNYASSRWCLEELMKILDCRKTKQQIVVPVFYDVDPSEMRNQTGSVKDALGTLKARYNDDSKLQRWKAALEELANLSGWHLQKRNESKFIQEIIQWLYQSKISQACLYVAKSPVGIQSRVERVISLLRIGKDDIRMVGIYGRGGIGKTTIAKAIFNLIGPQFEARSFLPNVRESSQKGDGFIHLQNKLLRDVLGVSSPIVDIVDQGISIIKQRLNSKKVLLILDDVDHLLQLEKLVGHCDWFGLGSRIIITTRDNGLLSNFGVDLQYPMDGLDYNEAFELLSLNAFKSIKPHNDFLQAIQEVIHYAGGLPLALEVMGSDLYSKSLHEWKSILDKYKAFPNPDIQNILKISYDGLEYNEKNIFLDIACFFKGKYMDYVNQILKQSGFFPDTGIKVLASKSLIKIEHSTLMMHDLLRDMGREIVREESLEEPGERSRLWFYKDICHVLEENTGTSKVKGILIDLPDHDEICIHPKAFNEMKGLRFFINRNAKIFEAPEYLSNKLTLLEWPDYYGDSMPSNFRGKELVFVDMPRSKLKSLESFKNCRNVTKMDFSYCDFLKETPDISGMVNLKVLSMQRCENLVALHPSVGCLEGLVRLNLIGCCNVKRFPRILRMRSLYELLLAGCSRLESFPEFECPMENLRVLYLDRTGVEHLPSSLQNLRKVFMMEIRDCRKLKHFPGDVLPPQLEYHGSPCGCSESKRFSQKVVDNGQSGHYIESTRESETSLGAGLLPLPLQTRDFLTRCVNISLSGSSIVCLPACIVSSLSLSQLNLDNCVKLQEIVALPRFLRNLFARGCVALERFSVKACDLPCLEEVDLSGCHCLRKNPVNDVDDFILTAVHEQKYLVASNFQIRVPGNEIPNWFSYYKEASSCDSCEIVVNEPVHLDRKFKGFVVCATFKLKYGETISNKPSVRIDLISGGVQFGLYRDSCPLNHIFFGTILPEGFEPSHCPSHFEIKWDDIKVRFGVTFVDKSDNKVFLLSCGVHLLYSHEESLTNRCTILDFFILHNNKYVHDKSSDDNGIDRTKIRERVEDMRKYLWRLAGEDLIGSDNGIQPGKRCRDDEDDANSKFKWKAQERGALNPHWDRQERSASSSSSITISDAEDEPFGESSSHQ